MAKEWEKHWDWEFSVNVVGTSKALFQHVCVHSGFTVWQCVLVYRLIDLPAMSLVPLSSSPHHHCFLSPYFSLSAFTFVATAVIQSMPPYLTLHSFIPFLAASLYSILPAFLPLCILFLREEQQPSQLLSLSLHLIAIVSIRARPIRANFMLSSFPFSLTPVHSCLFSLIANSHSKWVSVVLPFTLLLSLCLSFVIGGSALQMPMMTMVMVSYSEKELGRKRS